MKTIRDAVNKDETIVNRFICLADGINVESMSEEDFKSIWKAKWGEASFKKTDKELKELEKDSNYMPPDRSLDEVTQELAAQELVKQSVPGYNPSITSSDFSHLEEQPPPKHVDEINSIEDVLGSIPTKDNYDEEAGDGDVELNKTDDDGNTWKPISEEDYEKAKKGEL
jgi:hypothetical protein